MPRPNPRVLHLNLYCFYVACERLRDSRLNNKPVVIGGTGRQGIILACSPEARSLGLRPAMPMRVVRQRCPEALLLRADFEYYRKQSHLVTELLEAEAPLFEKASLQEFYLDLSGMDIYLNSQQWARELGSRISRESGLSLSGGIAVNKTVSKISTTTAGNRKLQVVQAGLEKAFIAPLSLQHLPGVGAQVNQQLRLRGIAHIGQLADLPAELLRRHMGKTGLRLWKKANVLDRPPIIPYRNPEVLSIEYTFEAETVDPARIQQTLGQMLSELAFDLRHQRKLTGRVFLQVTYNDFERRSAQGSFPHTADDRKLRQCALALLRKAHQRRIGLRRLQLRFDRLAHGFEQIDLFENTQRELNLTNAMDRIRRRFGRGSIRK